jgi:uncharacterized protein
MTENNWIDIEVVLALPDCQTIVALKVPVGTALRQAIIASGIERAHPEIEWASIGTAIYGVSALPTTVLHAHDRIEICRPLIAEPKQARRRRLQKSPKLRK